MVLVVVGHVKGFAEGSEEIELHRQERHAGKTHLAAGRDDHGEIALRLVVNAALGVALEQIAEIGAPGSDDRQFMRGGDFVEPRYADILDFDLAALGGEVVHPAMALQSQVDGEEIVFEATGEREEPVVLGRAEGEMHALAFGRILLPMIEPELALEFERYMKARRGAGRPAFIEPLLGGSIGIRASPGIRRR